MVGPGGSYRTWRGGYSVPEGLYRVLGAPIALGGGYSVPEGPYRVLGAPIAQGGAIVSQRGSIGFWRRGL